MSDRDTSGHPRRIDVPPNVDSHFSWLRTRLSLERTLMSWVRTATALIGFGFAIVQFFDRLGGMQGVAAPVWPSAPRYLGLTLIAAGILALLISAWQYQSVIGYLRSEQFHAIRGVSEIGMRTPLLAVSIVLVFIGLFAFAAVFTRFL
jgi:putative membrane protein